MPHPPNFETNSFPLLIFALVVRLVIGPLSLNSQASVEQSRFSMEGREIARPTQVPDEILQILRQNEYVLSCFEFLRREDEAPSQIPLSWFVGSKIHLDGPNEIDFVVRPRDLNESPSANRCLYGAQVIPFWVFRKMPKGFDLVLQVHEHDLTVLNTRSKGYRDIETWSSTATTQTTLIYKFDGNQYRLASKRTTE
jgi:hypothetical protein